MLEKKSKPLKSYLFSPMLSSSHSSSYSPLVISPRYSPHNSPHFISPYPTTPSPNSYCSRSSARLSYRMCCCLRKRFQAFKHWMQPIKFLCYRLGNNAYVTLKFHMRKLIPILYLLLLIQ